MEGTKMPLIYIYGGQLPTLVYMAREKRPLWPHNFKAGAMNALVNFQPMFKHLIYILPVELYLKHMFFNFFSMS